MYQVQYYPRCVMWGHEPLARPTTSFARGCKLWSRERRYYEDERHSNMAQFSEQPYQWFQVDTWRYYEDERHSNMAQFSERPYQWFQYPDLEKHYPGTWRVARRDGKELEDIVQRLVQPTKATTSRAEDIKQDITIFRLEVEKEKAKDIVFRAQSADTMRGKCAAGSSRQSSGSGFRQKTGKGGRRETRETWAVTQMIPTSSALPQL
ncbi:hypothetical protein ACOMHN_033457 [Nucella lapillus]